MKGIIVKSMLIFAAVGFFTSCAVIREGEVGVKRRFGKYDDRPYTQGLRVFNPFTSVIVKVPVRTENLEVALNIPSKEGLNIQSEVSILYNVIVREVPKLLRNIGPDYERNVILPVFRSAVSDVTARFYAKDMHTVQRGTIEIAIRDQMQKLLEGKGIEIEAVLLKSIVLPRNLARAIEEVLEAEQQSQRMQFVLLQEKQEADRMRIQAEGIRDAQNIISQGLDPLILQFKSIEAFMELSKSPNTKIIITDGGLPIPAMLNLQDDAASRTSGGNVSTLRNN